MAENTGIGPTYPNSGVVNLGGTTPSPDDHPIHTAPLLKYAASGVDQLGGSSPAGSGATAPLVTSAASGVTQLGGTTPSPDDHPIPMAPLLYPDAGVTQLGVIVVVNP